MVFPAHGVERLDHARLRRPALDPFGVGGIHGEVPASHRRPPSWGWWGSMTILPDRSPMLATTSSTAYHGTARTTMSAPATASACPAADALVPRSRHEFAHGVAIRIPGTVGRSRAPAPRIPVPSAEPTSPVPTMAMTSAHVAPRPDHRHQIQNRAPMTGSADCLLHTDSSRQITSNWATTERLHRPCGIRVVVPDRGGPLTPCISCANRSAAAA